MANKNVIRHDIVQIEYDVPENPCKQLIDEAKKFKKEMSDSTDTGTKGFKDIAKEAKKTKDEFKNSNKTGTEFKSTLKDLAKVSLSKLHSSASALDKKINILASSAGRAVKKVAGIGGRSLIAGVTALSIAVTGAGAGIYKTTELASDLYETQNKVEVAFRKSANFVNKWAKNSTSEMGLAKETALNLASGYGDMGTSMGLTRKEAAKMSTELTKRAADLASFKNMEIDEINTALNGVFTGETESLKRLGVVMTQTNLEAFAKGMKKNYKSMTEAEKVQLRYQYVIKKTKNAENDYINTGGGFANQLRTLKETFKDIGTNVGNIFMPKLQSGMKVLNDFAQKINKIFKNGWQDGDASKLADLFSGLVNKGISALDSGLPKVVDFLVETFDTVTPKLLTVITNSAPKLASGASKLIIGIATAITNNKSQIIKAAVDTASELIRAFYEAISGEKMSNNQFKQIKNDIKAVIGVAKTLVTFVVKNFKTVATVTLGVVAATKAYLAITKLHVGYEKVKNTLIKVGNVLSKAKIAWTTGETVATKAAAAAQVIFNAAMNACPVMLIVSGIAALVGGLAYFISSTKESKNELSEFEKETKKNIDSLDSFALKLDEIEATNIDYDKLISKKGNTLSDIDQDIDVIEKQITEVLKRNIKDQKGVRDDDLNNIRKYMKDLNKLENEKLDIYYQQQQAELAKMKIEIKDGNYNADDTAQIIADAKEAKAKTDEQIDNTYTSKLGIVENQRTSGVINEKQYDKQVAKIKKWKEDQLKLSQGYLDDVLGMLEKDAGNKIDTSAFKNDVSSKFSFDNTPKNGGLGFDTSNGQSSVELPKTQDVAPVKSEKQIFDNLKGQSQQIQTYFETLRVQIENGKKLTKEQKIKVSDILEPFENASPEMQKSGRNILEGLTKGLKDKNGEAIGTTDATATDMISGVRAVLGIKSPSRVFATIGGYTMQGFINGMQNKKAAVLAKAREIAKGVDDTIKKSLDERSPSKKTEKSGAFAGLGLVKGMKKTIGKVKSTALKVGVTAANNSDPSNAQPQYSPYSTSTTNNNSKVVKNYYSPQFNLTLQGASAAPENERTVKRWVKESFNECIESLQGEDTEIQLV